ncbi:hypothetical protein BDY24DRAFT_114892 [Mrakia frigida]|uniref:uncharacterized protein n=1 Tax=Mrakia frigida TaxID=29902 RepID=UPI003FCC1367
MLGLIGTVLLLLPSPYFRPLLNATQSSCFLRRTTTFLSLLVLGPSPSSTSSPRDSSTTNIFSWAWKQAKSEEEDASKRLNKTTRGRSSSIKEVLWAGLTAAVPKKLASTKEEQLEEEREEREKEWQEEPVQFRFEVMENQRWWLALDWTTTLAPSDRPVWCDTHLNPTPPPSQFTLPPASTILLPDPNSTTHQIQRTAIWHWLDPDWSIALHLPNSPTATSFIPPSSRSPPSSSNNPLPLHHKAGDHHHNSNSHHNHNHPHHASQPLSPTSAATTTTKHMSLGEQALSKGLERLKAVSLQASSSSSLSLGSLTGGVVGGGASQSNSTSNAAVPMTTPSRSSSVDAGKTLFAMSQPEGGAASIAGAGGGAGGVGETMMMEVDDLDAGTDESGWSYGGNKWEAMSAKGGLGKFTRRRRWTRLALLTEHVQLVPLPVLPSSPSSTSLTNPTPIGLPLRRSSSLSRPTSSPTREKNTPLPALPSQVYAASASKTEGVGGGDGNGALRMRLKKAVEGQGQGESA